MKTPQPPQPAYILHSRPYRDSSLILELLTPDFGRIGCVARGARRDKQRRQQALQPFTPLLVTLLGAGALKTLGPVENVGVPLWLKGRAVYAGLYANELLVRLLPEGESHYTLFAAYQDLLAALSHLEGGTNLELEGPLRRYELQLLQDLGTCPPLDYCALSGDRVNSGGTYHLEWERGLVPVHRASEGGQGEMHFSGAELLGMAKAVGEGSWPEKILSPAKRLTRVLLKTVLGEKPLQSRELFQQVYGQK
ncbi:DNA repair protein RecO [Microbulbifer sp. OS29]|uniref:DNA repair protein RecO n=1 Tax=Microbulbifer okhotskensis TaxID=2926617 RepID=A0A9X2J6S2_9GAMM|nr:DNA repair protein RecO [Microbulbifer okhotskensis]MCO1334920.1 DNA repair protein RecO [Microbulbifer okhotskensis]